MEKEKINQEECNAEDAASLREYGKYCILNANGNKEQINKGLRLLLRAHKERDPEATFLLGKLMWEGYIKAKEGGGKQMAKKYLFIASAQGSLQATNLLNEICRENYEKEFSDEEIAENGPLKDFDGNPIEIMREGVFTPIDAVLEYKEEKNILTFRVNLDFSNHVYIEDFPRFKEAVIRGIKGWEGEYKVFGGQQLTVKIEITTEARFIDHVMVFLVNDSFLEECLGISKVLAMMGKEQPQEFLTDIARNNVSFAISGKRWKVNSKKGIFLTANESDENFSEKIAALAKHEFGHALGLGDLYREKRLGMEGVKAGEYKELDGYFVSDRLYHLVMCEAHGAVSNNDIEMIVLAFSKNAKQNYQKKKEFGEISEALGRGN